jgi:hypothetical protein
LFSPPQLILKKRSAECPESYQPQQIRVKLLILSQEGNVRLLEPAELKTELKSKLQKMLEQC